VGREGEGLVAEKGRDEDQFSFQKEKRLCTAGKKSM